MLFRALNLPAYVSAPMRELGRYAVIALVVPGGCLIALALWVYRHRAWLTHRVRHRRKQRSAPQVPISPASAMVFMPAQAGLERRRHGRRAGAECLRS
jgi:hypothetical protein